MFTKGGGFFVVVLFFPIVLYAMSLMIKLPYAPGETQLVTRGYANQTHTGKDIYALDFAKNACEGWNTPVLAIADGVVTKVDTGHVHGEKNSYGNQVLIAHDDDLVSRYAHLNEVHVVVGEQISQGKRLGTQGNTGSVWGSACKEHPGTHVHVVLYKQEGATLIPVKPEPISGYTDILAGNWYLSDNNVLDITVNHEDDLVQEDESWWSRIWKKAKVVFGFSSDTQEVAGMVLLGDVIAPPIVEDRREENIPTPANIKEAASLTVNNPVVGQDIPDVRKEVVLPQIVPNSFKEHFPIDPVIPSAPLIIEKKNSVLPTVPVQKGTSSGGGSSAPSEIVQESVVPMIMPKEEQIPPALNHDLERPLFLVTYPENFPFFTSTTPLQLFGEKQEQAKKILINDSDEYSSYPSTTSWQARIPLSEGINTIVISGQHDQEQKIVSSSHDIVLDQSAPLFISVSSTNIGSASGTTNIFWEVTDAGVGVDIVFVESFLDESWVVVGQTTSSHILVQGTVDLLRLRGKDYLGNMSDWVTIDMQEPLIEEKEALPVVINEVAWMGTDAQHVNDEWIELYNPNEYDVAMDDWQLYIGGKLATWEKRQQNIEAKGYYLLERSDDNTVADISADGIFTVSGGIKNNGDRIEIVNGKQESVDLVDATEGWFAGELGAFYKTMERRDSTGLSTASSTWQHADGISLQGLVDGGGQKAIYGTPRQANKGSVLLKDLSRYYRDKFVEGVWTLSAEEGPYVIDYETVIPVGFTLQVEPGVVFLGKNQQSAIRVEGNLLLSGNQEAPVVITSLYDPVVGISLDTAAQPGDWSHIEVHPGGYFVAEFTAFRYCGHPYSKGNGWVYGQKVFAQCVSNFGGNVSMHNSLFSDGFIHMLDPELNSYLWMEQGVTVVEDSIFNGGRQSIVANNAQLSIYGGRFLHSVGVDGPVVLSKTVPNVGELQFEGNVFDGLSVFQLTIDEPVIFPGNMTYSMGSMTVNPGGTLTLQEGTTLKVRDRNDIFIRGEIISEGTIDSPVRITAQGEYWGSMVFKQGARGRFVSTIIEKGNHGGFDGKSGGMIWADGAHISFMNSRLVDARRPYNMVYAKDTELSLIQSEIAWSEPKEQENSLIVGVMMLGGHIAIESMFFQHMDRAINAQGTVGERPIDDLSVFEHITERAWWPQELFLPGEEIEGEVPELGL